MIKTTQVDQKLTDKERYRLRREQGLRGQGDFYFRSRGTVFGLGHTVTGGKPVSKKALHKNTKRARKAGQQEVS